MLLPIFALPLLVAALVPEHFGFEWQERMSSLGLEENNVTDTGCAIAVCNDLPTTIIENGYLMYYAVRLDSQPPADPRHPPKLQRLLEREILLLVEAARGSLATMFRTAHVC